MYSLYVNGNPYFLVWVFAEVFAADGYYKSSFSPDLGGFLTLLSI